MGPVGVTSLAANRDLALWLSEGGREHRRIRANNVQQLDRGRPVFWPTDQKPYPTSAIRKNKHFINVEKRLQVDALARRGMSAGQLSDCELEGPSCLSETALL